MEEEEELMLDRLEVLLIIIPIKLHLLPILRLWGGRQLSVCKGRCPGSKHMFFYKVYRGRGGVKPVYKNFAANWYVVKAFWQHGI